VFFTLPMFRTILIFHFKTILYMIGGSVFYCYMCVFSYRCYNKNEKKIRVLSIESADEKITAKNSKRERQGISIDFSV
jgi:hypothetical protein